MPQWDYYGGREQATAEANQVAWHTLGHSGLTRVKPGCPCYGQRMRHIDNPVIGLPGGRPPRVPIQGTPPRYQVASGRSLVG